MKGAASRGLLESPVSALFTSHFFFPVNWELPFLSLLSAYMSHFDLTSDKKGKKVFVIVFYVDNLRCAFLSSIKPLSLN